MISGNLDQLESKDIQSLIDNEVRESASIEYKQALPGPKDDDKREFLADVSAFANASGGDIVYGVSEKKGAQGQNTGKPDKVVGIGTINEDKEWGRLEQVLRTSIQPRLVGIQKRIVDCGSGIRVLIIRMPKSWQRPHMVTFKNLSRFYSRTSAGKYQMDVTDLRHGFAESGTAADRLKMFAEERVAAIMSGDTRIPMPRGPKLSLFVLPIGAGDNTSSVDIKTIGDTAGNIGTLIQAQTHERTYNAHGVACLWRTNFDVFECDAYTQVYRNGGIEAVEGSYINYHDLGKIPIVRCQNRVITMLKQYIELMNSWGLAFPYYAILSLVGVRGLTLDYQPENHFLHETCQPINDDVLMVPEVLIESSDVVPEKILKPSFDMIWQACGLREKMD